MIQRTLHISLLTLLLSLFVLPSFAVGASGMYQWSVELSGFISPETGKAPKAYLWVGEGCTEVKAVVFAQQNMTEQQLYRNPAFQERMRAAGVALLWVAPAFINSWDPASGCQKIFDEMLTAIAYQSGHQEIATAPIIPFGHSAQATMPWNFAAWNPDRTLCIISFHGDAPRTNLCGYGTANVEWGRTRNIDGIPGLMVEGEYEWWEARVRPALAFRMMYPKSCISFLADAGSGHFEIMPETAEYVALFIQKALTSRLQADGSLRQVNVQDGWLACRFNPDLQPTDGDGAKDDVFAIAQRPTPAPYLLYKGDPHDAFWYFDREMAELTEARYADTRGKQTREIGEIKTKWSKDGQTLTVTAPKDVRIEVICGPLRKSALRQPSLNSKLSTLNSKLSTINFNLYPYEAGLDNPKRCFSSWLVAILDGDSTYKRVVKPMEIKIPR